MDLPIPGTNSSLSTAGIFADNVQNFLGTGLLQIHPTATIVVNSIDDALNSSPSVTTLRDAINKANADKSEDLIVFDRSLFSTAQTITLKLGELDITHSLDIIAPRDTLTGGDLVTVSANKASRVFEIEKDATVNLSGLIVADGSVGVANGGGIKNSGTLTLDSSIVRNNLGGFGGGIYNLGTSKVHNSTFSRNSAGSGGGIYNSGTTMVDNNTISGNRTAGGPSDGGGGGIYNSGTTMVDNSTISGNGGLGFGGGIYNNNKGTLNVNNSTIRSNTVDSGFSGGGIYNLGITTIDNSTISGNSATRGSGGGIYNDTINSTLKVNNSTISSNSALFSGGGIVNSGTSTVNNSTISSNSVSGLGNVSAGGGIVNSGTLTVSNSTLSGNSVSGGIISLSIFGKGGGIFNSGSTIVRNTIIAANRNSNSAVNPDVSGTFNSLGYNLIGDSTGSTGFDETIGDLVGTSDWVIDPLLAPLAFNGGPTQTIALLPGSPAINAGDPTVLPTDPTTDQRGKARVRRGRADIGAFESSLKK